VKIQGWKLTLAQECNSRMSGNYLYVDFKVVTTIYCIVEGIILPLSCKLISNHVSLIVNGLVGMPEGAINMKRM
jgi:hypothetical protein